MRTSELLAKLFKTKNVKSFIKQHSKEMDQISLCAYLEKICKEKEMLPGHVIKRSGIERTYGHQIFNGRRKPSRDKIIQLALGFQMNVDEAQELLKAARKSTLYPKIKRDTVIIFALTHEISVDDTQATLFELSLPVLEKEE
jgi:transcriptional regulator with XRE-family HTH domain